MTNVTMPKAGQSMEEGTILRWHKREGEAVQQGEILLEIDTDKATVEVEAPESGTLLKILSPEGATVPVMSTIAILGETGEPERPKASPAARGAAARLGVSLGSVGTGSGPGGPILSSDVTAAARLASPPEAAPVAPAPAPAPAAPASAVPKPAAAGGTARPLTGMRRAIARSMASSKQAIPHFYTKLTIDAGALYAFYQARKAEHPCTINDIVTLACARVIRDFPAFRSRIEEEQVVEYPAASVGVAVAVEEGLVVPVVIGADSMSLVQLSGATTRIIEAARKGKVVAMGQGVFTISNLGSFGIEEFTAIINPPESGILAVGAIRESVVVRDAGIRPARVMTLTLSADHRLIDGLMAARFLSALKALLEAPDALL